VPVIVSYFFPFNQKMRGVGVYMSFCQGVKKGAGNNGEKETPNLLPVYRGVSTSISSEIAININGGSRREYLLSLTVSLKPNHRNLLLALCSFTSVSQVVTGVSLHSSHYIFLIYHTLIYT